MSKLALFGGAPTVTAAPLPWPIVREDDIAEVERTLRRSRDEPANLTSVLPGGVVAEFEAAVSARFGGAYCASTNSGGAALHAALMAVGAGAGDEVIVSPYTWGQSVACVLQQCAVPVFADIDPRTYTLDPASVAAAVSPHTKAIVVPHIYGQPADMAGIGAVAREHGLFVIEDCAQATGAEFGGEPVGTIGHIGCFSIGSGKQIIGGEGGFVLTRDRALFDRLLLATQHPVRGAQQIEDENVRGLLDSFIYTYRIHPLAAAICLRQLEMLDTWNDTRRRQLRRVSAELTGLPGLDPVFEQPDGVHVYHSYSPFYRDEELDGLDRAIYVAALKAEGVPIAASYVGVPLHLTPRFQERRWSFGGGLPWSAARREISYAEGTCPVAEERCARRDLSVYLGPNLYEDNTEYLQQIVAAFHKVTERRDELAGHAVAA
ncbi:DegT/DnrJ/EryC1/StrS family aminotransferase [Actinoplanes sp. NPDC026619]|uniref:DegT/DnrJ/EryC1/StrS family aminotransferase n=1 Tax=Actinoplanes sp. NPDC026619 TaxID=3155798 RepID=UPI0033FD54FE